MRSSVLAAAISLVALLGFGRDASANPELFHPDLAEAVSRLDHARGVETYVELRKIWASWDRANPSHVEEALREAEQSTRLSPPARAYAGILVAYARSRRGDLRAEQRRIADLGYVGRWLVVGPFDNEGKAGLDATFEPDAELAKTLVEGRSYPGKERPVSWRRLPDDSFPSGFVALGSLLRPEQKICAYLLTYVKPAEGSRTPRDITAWVGATGAFEMRWNGARVLKDARYRSHDPDRMGTRITLEAGTNSLALKVCGDDDAPTISLRLGDERGGPGARVTVSNDFADSFEAQKLAQPIGENEPKAVPGPRGPLQELLISLEAKKSRPRELHTFAEYLAVTGGDDPTEHLARDLARRAATAEPTIDRFLLASVLAEDRNQSAEWIAKAATFAKDRALGDRERVRLALARARLAEASQNWREAYPFFDEALALDPGVLEGLQGRAEMYSNAGLDRTALATLERAAERNPNGVMVLNMYASALRAAGRATEAEEAERRYANLRFDDSTFLAGMVDLALATRDRQGAEHWVSRLVATNPNGLWALGAAARAYERMGQPDRAIATYERALALAPDDIGTLRTLADAHAKRGDREKQLALLRRVLAVSPQQKDVREYVEHIVPPKPRRDEAYARPSSEFLAKRGAPAAGENQRTLVDLTVTTVFDNGLASRFRQVVFQPLSDAAAASARQYAFGYQADSQTVTLRGARVFRASGKVDEAVESGEGPANDPSITMYTSARTFYVQFPRLEPGDVVELRYRTEDVGVRNEFADYFGEVAYLQGSEPIGRAEYVVIAPKKRTLYFDISNLPSLKSSQADRGAERVHRFVAENVRAVKPEPAMPPWSEVLGHVHVSTYKDWKDLGKWYWGLVKDQFTLDDETRKLAREVAKGAKTDREKVDAVYGWVVKNTRYVALEFGIYGYKPRRCVQTVARGWGDCKDKATVIVSLLEELGVPATIVVVRTQLRGDFNPAVASFAPFDHAIAYVPSLDLYLDGTAEYTGSGELPTMDLGARALLVNAGDAKLVRLPTADPTRDTKTRTISAALTADGSARLELAYETSGSSASAWRRRYHADATLRERIHADLGREFPGFEALAGKDGVTTSDLENLQGPVTIRLRGVAPGFARKEGDRLSMPITAQHRLTPSYASGSKRALPVIVPPLGTAEDFFTIRLPARFKVISSPPEATADTRFGSYSIQVTTTATEVSVRSKLVVGAERVEPRDYAAWQGFCESVDRAFGHELVVGP